MKVLRKFAITGAVAALLFMANITSEPSYFPLGIQLISDANAIFGVRRRTRRRALFFGYEAGRASADADNGNGNGNGDGSQKDSTSQKSSSSDSSSSDSSSSDSSSSQKSSTSQKTTESKHTDTASAHQSAKTEKVLPLGAVVTALPSGCATTTSNDIEYYHCGPNFYRAVFQGNSLVYVTAKP